MTTRKKPEAPPAPASRGSKPESKSASSRSSSAKPDPKPASSRGSAQSKPAAAPTSRSHSSAPSSHKSSQQKPLFQVSPERKVDLIGVGLGLLGLLTLLGLISPSRGNLIGIWLEAISGLFGWGVYELPLALLAVGIWLILRHTDRLPPMSLERMVGLGLVFFNLLAWAELFGVQFKGKLWGGYAGQLIYNLLAGTLGVGGAAVVLAAWLIMSLAFFFDLSIAELFRWLGPIWDRLRRRRPVEQPYPYHPISAGLTDAPNDLPSPDPVRIALTQAAAASSAQAGTPASSAAAAAGQAAPAAAGLPASAGLPGAAQSALQPPVPAVPEPPAPVWVLPNLDDILDPSLPGSSSDNKEQERARIIEETLKSFGAPSHVVEIQRGPAITRYGVEPDFVETRNGKTRVRVSKIVSLADDLTLALACPRVRIQAPVPGRSYVGIEVPNLETSRVTLRDAILSESFKKQKNSLRFALGQDVAGTPISTSLPSMPHLLVAGTTGSGKSVCVNAILSCLLLNNTPDDLRLILVDPKRVELTGYNGIPHLLAPVVVEAEKVIGALQWMTREMDSRYQKFAETGVRNLNEFNDRMRSRNQKTLPYIVVVIDELADLMMLAPDETESTISRLAQLARATGIHLVIATQRPSVNVITGLIKANFPARIAFAVASNTDSRVILDQPGAERLLGRGDMLFQAPDAPAPVRLQGVYVADGEIQRLVEYWRAAAAEVAAAALGQVPAQQPTRTAVPSAQNLPVGAALKQVPLWEEEMAPQQSDDPLYKDAVELARREGRASISMLQRRMRIGYTRAARLIDKMEEKGIIGPLQPNSQVREILDYGQTSPPAE